MDNVTYEIMQAKIAELTLQNKHLKRANINAKRENKYLKRVIGKLKDEAAKDSKPKYRRKHRNHNRW